MKSLDLAVLTAMSLPNILPALLTSLVSSPGLHHRTNPPGLDLLALLPLHAPAVQRSDSNWLLVLVAQRRRAGSRGAECVAAGDVHAGE